MAENDWKFDKSGGACCACQAQFGIGAVFYSVLLQNESGLARQDYCAACFDAKRPVDIYYFWKKTQPDPDDESSNKDKRPVVDIDYVLEFFRRMEGDRTAQKIAFRYILALMLARKKVLVFESRKNGVDGQCIHQYRQRRGGDLHEVLEPILSEEEVDSVSAELGALLGLNPPPAAVALMADVALTQPAGGEEAAKNVETTG